MKKFLFYYFSFFLHLHHFLNGLEIDVTKGQVEPLPIAVVSIIKTMLKKEYSYKNKYYIK